MWEPSLMWAPCSKDFLQGRLFALVSGKRRGGLNEIWGVLVVEVLGI